MVTVAPLVPPLVREQMDAAVQTIQNAQNIVLACHVNPDGDTLGSMLALAFALEHLGKTTTLLSHDPIPPTLQFLPEIGRIQARTEMRDFDLAIVVDAGELARVGGENRAVIESAPRLMDIDHHVTAGVFGDVRLLDATAAATAEIIYDLIHALGVEITVPMAQCLLCGLLTDTGSFRYLNVTPRTMAIGAEMIAVGALPNTIAENVYENKPFAAQKLLGRALDSLQVSPDGRIVWAHITQADFVAFGANDQATEGIVNEVRSVQGTDVALLLREMPTGKLRVSLRARPPADVSLIAAHFGGGGHRLAAGCTLDGPLADAEARLIAEVAQQLAGTPSTAL